MIMVGYETTYDLHADANILRAYIKYLSLLYKLKTKASFL